MSEPTPSASTSNSNGSAPAEASSSASGTSSRAAVKQMSKAERRALQEQQRQAKQEAAANPRPAQSTRPAAAAAAPKKATSTSTGQSSASANTTHSTPFTASNLFNHLTISSSQPLKTKSEKDVHPAIAKLGLQWAEFRIVGANARCISMLEAFKQVIRSYVVPSGAVFSRHLPSHLSPQIEHLYKHRSRSLTLGNAIRYLKWEIAQIPLEMEEEEAKDWLCERIDYFVRDRIVVADKVIEQHTLSKIKDGDVVMTYARSSVVESSLIEAKNQGRLFEVIVVDSRPMLEGKNLCASLSQHGITTTYVLLSALGPVISSASLVLLGTHALLSDGAMFSRAGTATVAMMAKAAGKPVVCCCETYKFTDRIMLDSIGRNEQGPSSALLPAAPKSLFDLSSPASPTLPNSNLSIFNLLYDVSRPDDVTCVISEAGLIPVKSVPAVLREFKPLSGTS